MTPARPTSDPVPAVVGTATIGAIPAGSARVHQSPMSSKSHIGRVWPRMKATTLPQSSAEPPPKATTPSCPPSRMTLRPAATFSSVGFGCTSEKTAAASPPAASTPSAPVAIGRSRSPGSVTKSGRAMPAPGAGVGQLVDAAGAEADRGGVVPVCARGHDLRASCRW